MTKAEGMTRSYITEIYNNTLLRGRPPSATVSHTAHKYRNNQGPGQDTPYRIWPSGVGQESLHC